MHTWTLLTTAMLICLTAVSARADEPTQDPVPRATTATVGLTLESERARTLPLGVRNRTITGLSHTAVPVALRPDSSRARVFRWIYQDLGPLARTVATPKFGLYAASTMAGTFGLAWLDDDAGEAVQSIYHGTFKDALDVVDYLGGPKINLPVAVLAGGSLLTNSTKFQDAAFTSLQTLIYAGLIGYGLKGLFGRERPEWSDNTYAFFSRTGKNPFSHEGNSSYPGGHAIAAFGIITPWVMYYPSPITYALYILPVGTGVSRIAVDKHWATDIAVGAFIGISMGRWLSRLHQTKQRRDGGLSVSILEDGKLFSVVLPLHGGN